MTTIHIRARADTLIRRSVDDVFRFVRDASETAKLFPGVERSVRLNEHDVELTLASRSAFGHSFQGKYVARYVPRGPHELEWKTVRGNMQSAGVWIAEPEREKTRLRVEMQLELDPSVPALLERPTALFVSFETKRCLVRQLERVQSALEAARA